MEKRFIVVEESWEYNDQYYFQPEDEPYTLHEPRLYTKEEADKICAELNSKHRFENYDDDSRDEYTVEPYKVIQLSL